MDNIYGNYDSSGNLVGVFRNSGDVAPFDATDTELEDCCCAEPAPCSCPYSSTSEGPQLLQIDGYTDGDIPACSDCKNTSGNVWGGDFGRNEECGWQANIAPANSGGTIDGKNLAAQAYVGLGTVDCVWTLSINCYDDVGTTYTIWSGTKDTGNDPTGTYTFDSGCSGSPSTLTIVDAT